MTEVVGLRFVAEGEREAERAIKRFKAAKDELTRSVLDGASRVQSASAAWEKANTLYRQGAISANGLRTAQTQVARELAVLNNYTRSNGTLNTQRALAEMRAAQAARDNARATEENARATQRASEQYQRLRTSIDPAFAAQQRMRQAHETVREALAREAITRQQAADTLRLYRQRLQETGQSTVLATDLTGRLRTQFLATANTIAILDGPLGGIASRFSAFGVLLGRTGLLLGATAVGFTALAAAIGRSVRTGMEAETSMLSLEAAVRATGGAAGVTALQIEGLARSIEASTLASRDAVRQAAVQLLTFESITGEMFGRTLRVSQDIAQTFGRDVGAVAVQVAKALENPAQSLASLERAYGALRPGIRQTTIALLEQGDVVRAHTVLMEELERRFGGLGAAAADGLAGAFDTLSAAFTDFRENLFSVVDGENRVTSAVNGMARAVSFAAENLNRFVALGQTIAGVVLVRYVAGIRLASVATAIMTANVTALNAAFTRLAARTGVGLAIVVLGELVYQLGFARDGSNMLRAALDEVRMGAQENVASANALVAEISRLGRVSREAAEDIRDRVIAQRIGLQTDIDAARAAVLMSDTFRRLAEEEARLQRRLEQGRFRAGGRERAEQALEDVRRRIQQLFSDAIPPEVQEAFDRVAQYLIDLESSLRRASGATVEVGEGSRELEASLRRSGEQLIEQNVLRQRELELLRSGFSEQQARLIVQREQEAAQLDLLEAEARTVAENEKATREARRFALAILEAVAHARDLAPALDGAAAAAARLAANAQTATDALRQSLSALNQLTTRQAIAEGRLEILRGGGTQRDIVRFEAEQAQQRIADAALAVTDEREAALARLFWQDQVRAAGDAAVAIYDADQAARDYLNTTGGGGAGIDTIHPVQELINNLETQIERERQLLGLNRAQRTELEILFQLQDANRRADIQMSQEALENAARRIAAEQEKNEVLTEQQKIMQDIARTIENSMVSAFMSIVDGTKSAKDAFRDMARAILSELFRVLVVQRLVGQFQVGGGGILGALAGGLGSRNANGNAFYGGNVIPFANGGVVTRPTTFPMSGGRTGLMGEAGPEAIMPLKRGKDGKLGVTVEGNGGTTVNQTFTFNLAANGDESVKKIVAQAAPQIVEAAKSGVLDARRRGGAYRAAFG